MLLQRKGVRATAHWMFGEQLRALGVEAVEGKRVVRAVATVPCWEEKEREGGKEGERARREVSILRAEAPFQPARRHCSEMK